MKLPTIVVLCGWLPVVLAQAATAAAAAEGWLPLVGQLTTGGVLVWYLWYNVSVTQPAIAKEHREAISEIVEKFDASLKEEREWRTSELSSLREKFRCLAANGGHVTHHTQP